MSELSKSDASDLRNEITTLFLELAGGDVGEAFSLSTALFVGLATGFANQNGDKGDGDLEISIEANGRAVTIHPKEKAKG